MIPYWSTATNSAEHKDLQAVCLATSNNGRCALISRRAISVISTDNIGVVDYNIRRDTKWDTTYAEFSTLQQSLIAITNAQTIQIFNTDDNSPTSLIHTLRGHTRTITDLNWSFSDKASLATASYDNYVHIWDLRDSRKPVHSMHSIAGATQVKWSKMNDSTLATSHEGDVRIWDKRKSNAPIMYLTAHLSKINGIDWNPFNTTQFVTCSQDGNIKFWDINTYKGKSEFTLTTGLPVWKARFTPFENGLMTALVPQLRRTGENNSLWMWNITSLDQPLHSFAGHLDVVLDFGWYFRSNSECELITWAKDCILRLWKVDRQMFNINSPSQANDGGPVGETTEEYHSDSESTKLSNVDLSRSSNPSPISSKFESTRSENEDSDAGKLESVISSSEILNLSQEFSLVNLNIPNIIIEELNANKRICTVAVKSALSCRLKILFPPNYPHNVIPQFMFLNENENPSKSLSESMKQELIKVLRNTATSQVQRNRSCLEKCLRQFIQTFDQLTASNQQNITPQKTHTSLLDLLPSHKYGSYLDASVPFPRTSGARFCSSEILVCFGRPPHLEQMNAPTEFTPRSLSALSAYLTTHVRAYNSSFQKESHALSISNFYSDSSRKRRLRHRNQTENLSPKHKTPNLCGPVSVFSAAKLLPISRTLAEQYLLTSKDHIIGLCEMNARIANNNSRRDLFQAWSLVKLSAMIYLKDLHNTTDKFSTTWSEHPFGRKMIQSMIEHYALKCNDIQMAAMIACAFSSVDINFERSNRKNVSSFALDDSSSYNLPVPNVTQFSPATPDSYGDWSVINSKEINRTRSNSWSDYNESGDYATYKGDEANVDNDNDDQPTREGYILDANLMLQYDYYKKIYADILYRWKLIEKRALLLKTIKSELLTENKNLKVPFAIECNSSGCKKNGNLRHSEFCKECKKMLLKCIICTLPVRGATNHCLKCGHGGHSIHMQEWFQSHSECPTGCGCVCLDTS